MRYEIKNGTVVESMFIDADYDTYQDALNALADAKYGWITDKTEYDKVVAYQDETIEYAKTLPDSHPNITETYCKLINDRDMLITYGILNNY